MNKLVPNFVWVCLFVFVVAICRLALQNGLTDSQTTTVPSFQSILFKDPAESKTKSKAPHQQRYAPCTFEGIQNVSTVASHWTGTTKRFHTTSFRCRREIPPPNGEDYFLAFVEFEIYECPPAYALSTFQLIASTNQSRVMGHVGGREAVKDGCGIYNASVAIIDSNAVLNNNNNNKTGDGVSIDLFWTSNHSHYSNRIKDITDAMTIKQEQLSDENISALLTPERLAYLKSHLDPLPYFPIKFRITEDDDQQKNERIPPNNIDLPDCSTLPIQRWSPVGVFKSSNDSTVAQEQADDPWPFRSARCIFPRRSLDELNNLLGGIRIKFLADSHGNEISIKWRELLCPEMNDGDYFQNKYDCLNRTNQFNVGYRFFRAVYSNSNFDLGHDGLSEKFRRGDLSTCRSVFGLGLYNATIMVMPTWLFVYETNEGLHSFLISIRSMLENCKAAYSYEFANHMIFIQTPFARDSFDFPVKKKDGTLRPLNPWRGIHNYKMEAFSMSVQRVLDNHVDGIIPAFDLIYARTVTVRTHDGIHFHRVAYEDVVQLQATAVLSAMRSKDIKPLINGTDKSNPRWFVGADME